MHDWSDKKVDWNGISDAAEYIGLSLRKWGRVSVTDYKEKYGTVRIYCRFGWYQIHDITHPGYHYIQWRPIGHWHTPSILNYLVVPLQTRFYTYLYGRAIRKWPHLRKEILYGADYPEFLGKYGMAVIDSEIVDLWDPLPFEEDSIGDEL